MVSRRIDFNYIKPESMDWRSSFVGPDDKPTFDLTLSPMALAVADITSVHHSGYSRHTLYTDPVAVEMILQCESFGNVVFRVTLGERDGFTRIDQISLYGDSHTFADNRREVERLCASSIIVNHAKEYAHLRMTDWLGRIGPDVWAKLFYGRVLVKHPFYPDENEWFLTEVIMDLNDHRKWSRERIAEWVDSLGDIVPSIPMLPYSWILEDRPVVVDQNITGVPMMHNGGIIPNTQWKV